MISVFAGAVIFSIWLIILFFGKSIGLSMLLFIVPITMFIIHILDKNKKIVNKKAKLLIIPITLLSSTYFIFNNKFFNVTNIFAIPILVFVMIFNLFNEKTNKNFISKLFQILFIPLGYTGDALEKTNKAIQEKINVKSNSNRKEKIKRILKAILITLPIALLILLLLSSADKEFGNIFESILENILNAIGEIKISGIIARIMFMFCAFLYFISFFYYIIFGYKKAQEKIENKNQIKDNFTIKMILGVLNVIYLIFCIIQIKSLIIIKDDINLSLYARKGFFQLMIVSIINLATILIAKKRENKGNKRKIYKYNELNYDCFYICYTYISSNENVFI